MLVRRGCREDSRSDYLRPQCLLSGLVHPCIFTRQQQSDIQANIARD
jgi:hypothetical protein